MKPMLAGKAPEDLSQINYPVLCSPKLDGIRCVIIDGVPKTRSLKNIPNKHTQQMFTSMLYNGLDGELIVGSNSAKDVYRETVSGVMTQEGIPDITFYVFDSCISNHPFDLRLAQVEALVDDPKTYRVKVLAHSIIKDQQELLRYEDAALRLGFEGVMIRDPRGAYKHGRSTTKQGGLLKLKRFNDSEAKIIDIEELLHNANEAEEDNLGHTKRSSHKENKFGMDTMGALVVQDIHTGVEFKIGTGFDQSERQNFWDNFDDHEGEIVKYKFLSVGVKDKPRHPVYLGLRDKADLGE